MKKIVFIIIIMSFMAHILAITYGERSSSLMTHDPIRYSNKPENLSRTNHFNTVWSGNGFQHMNFYVTSASINNLGLEENDEIAVFDGVYCVGMVKLVSSINEYVSFVASLDDSTTPETDGYSPGHDVSFKIWKENTSTEYSYPQLLVEYSAGNPVFQIGGTVVIQLSVQETQYSLGLNVEPVNCGTTTGSGWYYQGNQVTLTVLPNPNYHFQHWQDSNGNIISNSNPYIYFMPDNDTILVAVLEETTNTNDPNIANNNFLVYNFPNPFNPITQINYIIKETSPVEIDIFNAKGQKILTLLKTIAQEGNHSVTWDGRDANKKEVGNGVYFYRMKSKGFIQTGKMLLLK